MKLFGIIDAIVQSVRNKSIDLNYVFTKDFAIQYGYSDDDRYEFFDQLRSNWYDSLPYINSIAPDDTKTEFGFVTLSDGSQIDGSIVACWVIKNIFADFLITGEMFVDGDFYNALVKPDILFNKNDFWVGEKAFTYFAPENEVIQFSASSQLIAKDIDSHAVNSRTDLMQLFEVILSWQQNNDNNPIFKAPLKIYGFMASLIYAMFADIARRKIFNYNWFEDNLAIMEGLTSPIIDISHDELPTNLHITANKVNEAYFDTALDAISTKLSENDRVYDNTS